MIRFVQIHLLTSYPPANLNRDDLGRPKTAMMGGANRLRVSSQSLKRAWRTSDVFKRELSDHIGVRTKEMGVQIYQALIEKGVEEKQAMEWTKKIAGRFGKLKGTKGAEDKLVELKTEQLVHFSPEEQQNIDDLVGQLAGGNSDPDDKQLDILRLNHTAADIGLFGRMLADKPKCNTEAAAQVAHAISVHKVTTEDDFFTAVDDLNKGEEDMGAGHLGETEFAAGLFYLYLCIDRELLTENLSANKELASRTLAALIRAAATVAPTGKQNSFASRARASYILCEVGDAQPRSLSVAFLKPVAGRDMLSSAVKALEETQQKMDTVYGDAATHTAKMNVNAEEGSLQGVIDCATR